MRVYTNTYGIKTIFQLLHNYKITTKTRWIYDKKAVYNQITNWNKAIPWIKPYYAIKSNPSENLLNDIVKHPYNVGLDAASISEIDLALKYTDTKNIIYTNPHTINHELNEFTTKSLNIKVIDNICELQKLVNNNIKCKLLIRINSGNYLGDTKFDTKFGASINETKEILDFSKQNKIVISGISFHIGSGGKYNRETAYYNSYIRSLVYLEYIKKYMNISKPILNIGGGLLYNTNLKQVLGWTEKLPFEIIAEPGRYISEPSHHLFSQVIAITSRGIYLDNGIYHELNCYQRDHWNIPELTNYIDITDNTIDVNNNTINIVYKNNLVNVFGPTCDSGDTINECKMPKDISIGDWIFLPNMGAYTNAGMIEFNGIKGASSFCVVNK